MYNRVISDWYAILYMHNHVDMHLCIFCFHFFMVEWVHFPISLSNYIRGRDSVVYNSECVGAAKFWTDYIHTDTVYLYGTKMGHFNLHLTNEFQNKSYLFKFFTRGMVLSICKYICSLALWRDIINIFLFRECIRY